MSPEYYVGARKVVGITELDKKTPAGSAMVSVIFEEGKSVETTLARYNLTKTEEPSDATAVGQVVRKHVGSLMYAILAEYNLSMAETTPAMDEVVALINAASAKATNILFDVEYPDDKTLLQINDILLAHVEATTAKDTHATAPEGGATH